nr:probable LRR receptor-like serine/threonine-protein kinase At3g47570 [Arachis hypogaea]
MSAPYQQKDDTWRRLTGGRRDAGAELEPGSELRVGAGRMRAGCWGGLQHDTWRLVERAICAKIQRLLKLLEREMMDAANSVLAERGSACESGVLTELIGNLSSNLVQLAIGFNQISGRIPEGIGKLINLDGLGMERNFLEGTIPFSIGKLKNLVKLTLGENKLFGNIPLVIGNLTMLSELDLSLNKFEGFVPFTLGNCTKMEIFSAHDNNLSGNIPIQTFGHQQGLIALSLYSNSFTGSIPSDLGNLNHLSFLYLQENKLSGDIPMGLGACSALTDLVLKRNSFHGSIPSFLGSLLSLEFLDLSNSNFSSIIPHELVNLKFLSLLNLSFNHLSGEVPVGGVFNNVTAISLVGNKDLCGGIPQLNIPACPMLPLQKKHKRSLKKRVILVIAFGGILISCVTFISIYLVKKKAKKLATTSLALQYCYVKVSYGELHQAQATNGFSSSNLVGAGRFGTVYRGILIHFERPVAVKVLKLQTRGASKSFMAECKALGKIKHRNLVNILTCCSSVDYKGDDFKAIVFEFMPNGSLESLLHNTIEDSESTNQSLNLMQRVNIALDVAFALDYLHNDLEEAVVHCDIKPSNVVLDDEVVAHLGDFGLARLVHGATSFSSSNQASSSAIKGTIGYIPQLKNVRHAPDMRFNLISVKALDQEGYYTSFGSGKCKITKGAFIVAREDNSLTTLYRLQAKLCKEDVNIVDDSSSDLWGPFEEYCKGHGIKLEKIVPKTPQHNGVVERMNHTINDRVRAFVHIPRDERSKPDGKSKQCIFVGYGHEDFGYRLWDPLPKGKKAFKNKWVFKLKADENVSRPRYKAQLVVKGFEQKKDMMTKSLPAVKFDYCKEKAGLVEQPIPT